MEKYVVLGSKTFVVESLYINFGFSNVLVWFAVSTVLVLSEQSWKSFGSSLHGEITSPHKAYPRLPPANEPKTSKSACI